jgi:transposase InsO family protein
VVLCNVENSTWGEERIANELKLKLGIRVSPRTVEKYLRDGPVRTPDPKQRWLTFVHNHAKGIVACDFFVVVTATFRTLYVFVVMELGTRRILHHNVTAHPTAEWTLQQFREALPGDHPYRFVIHDRDSIFSKRLDKAVTDLGVRVLRTPVRAPMANSVCERFGGTLRRECLDLLIPLGAWLAVSPATGAGNGSVTLSANLTGLQPGSYTGQVAISATGTSNAQLIISVTLIVTNGATSATTAVTPANTDPRESAGQTTNV